MEVTILTVASLKPFLQREGELKNELHGHTRNLRAHSCARPI
jgi:hypothetical protein